MYNFIAVSNALLSIALLFTPIYFTWYLKFAPCIDCLIIRAALCLILVLALYSLIVRFKPILILFSLILGCSSIIAAAVSGSILTMFPQICAEKYACLPALQPYLLGENLTGWGLLITLLVIFMNGVFVTLFHKDFEQKGLKKFNIIQKISIFIISIAIILNTIDITYNIFKIF